MKKRTPVLHRFKSEEHINMYAIKETSIADDFAVGLSGLYHQMNPKVKILKKGQRYTTITKPYAYFKFRGRIIPVYDDDPGQQDCIYYNGRFIGAGAYTMYPYNVMTFCDYLKDEIDEENKKAKKVIPPGDYCTGCPYLEIRIMSRKDYPFDTIPCHYDKGKKVQIEYCKYLQQYLYVQDRVKDCTINKKYNRGGGLK